MLPEVSRGGRRLEMAPGSASASASAAPPLGARCAVCRGVDISVPHQANCSHWFCGHCIVGVCLHGSVLRPSGCPVCRRPITLLVPSEVASLLRDEPEIAPVMNRIEQYNGRFAGVPHSMIQRQFVGVRPSMGPAKAPLRFGCGDQRTQRAVPTMQAHVHAVFTQATLALLYLASPIDLFPEAFLGYRGLLDDILVLIVAYAYISAAYRDILVARHAA